MGCPLVLARAVHNRFYPQGIYVLNIAVYDKEYFDGLANYVYVFISCVLQP